MAVVHREANWGEQTEPSVKQQATAPSRPGPVESSNDAKTDPVHSNGDAERPTIEISTELVEARDVAVVAVTTDPELRTALSAVLPKNGLLFANSPEQVLTRSVPSNCAVLVVEQTLSRSTFDQLKSHLKESAPALVCIMVGTDDNGSSLVGMLSAGRIDRFIVKPYKLGPTRSALRSALLQHHSLRQCAQAERTAKPVTLAVESALTIAPKTRAPSVEDKTKRGGTQKAAMARKPINVGQHKTEPKGELKVANDDIVELSREKKIRKHVAGTDNARHLSLPAWALAFAAGIVVLVFIAFGVFTRTPELNRDKVIAGHLAAAHRAFELGSYVEPPELSAAHFYSAALELDPLNVQAKLGLEAIANRLIAHGKELIVAGDLLSAQSTLDSARRIQPNHRELAEVTASLLSARESERSALQAARSATRENVETIVVAATQAAASVREKASLGASLGASPGNGATARKLPQRNEIPSQISFAPAVATRTASAVESIEKMHATSVADSPSVPQQPVRDDAAVLAVSKLTSVPAQNPVQNPNVTAIGNETASPNAQSSSSSVSIDPAIRSASIEATGAPKTNAANDEPKLLKYVEPEYPRTWHKERAEGWVDVHFLVTTDGSVVNAHIGKGSLDSTYGRAALAAVTQWKYSPAPRGVIENRPMNVRLRFQLADARHT